MRRLLLCCLLLLAGCAGLRHPTEVDAARANTRWPGADLAALQEGRRLYVLRCSGCHNLYMPESRPPEAWPGIVHEMAEEFELAEGDRALIEQYLVTMASP